MKLLADSSIWIDLFRSADSPAKELLRSAISLHTVLVGDLILAEVLRGVPNEAAARRIETAFEEFDIVTIGGGAVAREAARNYRLLRGKGLTIRGTIDLLIGTWCVMNDVALIHSDRDFNVMERHLGLRRWSGSG